MVYTVFYKTSSFVGYCFLDKNSIHPQRRDVFSFVQFQKILVKFQICSFIDYKITYDKSVVVLSDGKEISYRVLIGADGINSKVRSYVGRSWKASVLCFEKFIPNFSDEDTIKIDFDGILGGYSWRIPGKDRIGVGLGEFYFRGMKKNLPDIEDTLRTRELGI